MFFQKEFQSNENPAEVNVSCFRYFSNETDLFSYHCHSYFEIAYLIKGNRYETINGTKLNVSDNSLIFIPPLAAHSNQNISKVEDMVLQFSRKFLHNNTDTMGKASILIPAGELLKSKYIQKGGRIYLYLQEIAEISHKMHIEGPIVIRRIDSSYEWKLNGLTLNLLSEMLKEGLLSILENSGDESDTLPIERVMYQIFLHPEQRLDMHDAAKLANMGYSNFCRTFKQLVGYNYVDFCNFALVLTAEELLRNTGLSVTQVSDKLNIGTISYFNRLFKKYNGNTPLIYRKQTKSKVFHLNVPDESHTPRVLEYVNS
jgi:AraC-like DNA-binding protein